jgi:hypothetical protein
VCTFCLAFLADELAGFDEKFLVPCCGKASAAGETGGANAVEELCAPHAVGAVTQTNRGDTETGEGGCVPEVLA